MDSLGDVIHGLRQSRSLEPRQPRRGLGKGNLRQPFQYCRAGDSDEMVQQRAAQALPLILINDGESDLGRIRFYDNVAPTADNRGPIRLRYNRYQRDMFDEINFCEIIDLLFRE